MLTKRAETILKIVVAEYITTAVPVPSEHIARGYGLGVSPATIRNEMARLEDGGYIVRPHISAGAVPTDRAYRYYVESVIADESLPESDRESIREMFEEVRQELNEWLRVTTGVLAKRLKA